MVVVTDSWGKFHRNSAIEEMSDEEIITNDEVVAKAVLICRPNSHPFKDRTLLLEEPIKVGRSVARAKPKTNNAIFDCKVLSRNHAVLWFENGKFYLKDTKSSNGTFVNTKKLTAETENYEVNSGDLVQFGVCVIENNRKVTHGCIIAILKLYLPDGKEATASPSINENSNSMIPIDELYRLNQIIQEASDREESLRIKLSNLQSVVDRAKIATNVFWANYVGEERLLSRISTLESQLQQSTKNWTEDRCKQELTKIQEENVAYQLAAIEALEKVHSDKLDTIALATELKLKYDAAQQDLCLEKRKVVRLEEELDQLVKRLLEEQTKNHEEGEEYEAKLRDLQSQLDIGIEKLQNSSSPVEKNVENKTSDDIMDEYNKSFKYVEDDLKIKEEKMQENEKMDNCHVVNNNQEEYKNITLMVQPVKEEKYSNEIEATLDFFDSTLNVLETSESDDEKEENQDVDMINDIKFKDEEKPMENDSQNHDNKEERGESEIDSGTIKHQMYQSAQNEMKKKIETLQNLCTLHQEKVNELEKLLYDEKELTKKVASENNNLKHELDNLKSDLNKSIDRNVDLESEIKKLKEIENKKGVEELEISLKSGMMGDHECNLNDSNISVSYKELVSVEEELVTLKEKYAQVSNDKSELQKQVELMRQEINQMRNQSHNTTFFYVAPLVLIVLYLLISKMFS